MINLAFGIKVKMRLRFYYNECSDLFPGFLLCLTIAAAARLLSEHYSAPQMLFALLLGIAFHFLADEGKCAAGVQFSSKAVLRFGVALLGMRLTINDVVSLGWAPVGLIISGVGATIVVGILLSRLLGRRRRFGTLTGGGQLLFAERLLLWLFQLSCRNRRAAKETQSLPLSRLQLSVRWRWCFIRLSSVFWGLRTGLQVSSWGELSMMWRRWSGRGMRYPRKLETLRLLPSC